MSLLLLLYIYLFVSSFPISVYISCKADWLRVNPWGIRYILRWIKEHYGNPPIYITENGRATDDSLEDWDRIYYYKYYINEVLKGK